jgi:hypothetical protein
LSSIAAGNVTPDTTGVMRPAEHGKRYVYHLDASTLPDSSATYRVTVTFDDTGQTVSATFGVRP